MSREPDAAARLVRALTASLAAHGCIATIEPIREARWESGLFSGTRHVLVLSGEVSAPLDAWLAALPEIDLPMPGQFVADVDVTERSEANGTTTLTIEALTILS